MPGTAAVADYLERITRERGFTTKFSRGEWEGLMRVEITAGEAGEAVEAQAAGEGGR
jgi:hypothetical protein